MKRSGTKKIKTMIDSSVIMQINDDIDYNAHDIVGKKCTENRRKTSIYRTVLENVKNNISNNMTLSQQIYDFVYDDNYNYGDDFNTKKITIEQLSDAYKITKTI